MITFNRISGYGAPKQFKLPGQAIKKFLSILTPKERTHLFTLGTINFILALLQSIAVASILPFMEIAANPSKIEERQWLMDFLGKLNVSSAQESLLYLGIATIALLTLANLATIWMLWKQQKFIWNIYHSATMRLLDKYLGLPYEYFINQYSSQLLNNLTTEMFGFVNGAVFSFMQILSKAMVAIAITALLFLVNPKTTLLIAMLFSVIYFLIFLSRNKVVKQLGKIKIKTNKARYYNLTEMLRGIKTLKLYQVESFFVKRFEKASLLNSSIPPRLHIITQAPKYVLETVAFGSIIAVLLFQLRNGKEVNSILPLLSLYALAAYKLMPAFQAVFSSVTQFRHSIPIIQLLHEEINLKYNNLPKLDSKKHIEFNEHIQVDGLDFSFENNPIPIIEDLSLTIPKGKTVAFIGQTGSGKTTIVDILAGLLHSKTGRISVDGEPVDVSTSKNWQQRIGYVTQHIFLYDDTIANNILISDEEVDQAKMEAVCKIADIHDFIVNELPEGYNTEVGENGVRLSGGQRQRIGLARALYKNPEILILDEATSALDNQTEKKIIDSIWKLPEELTVIVIAHRLATVKFADKIYLIDKGKLLAEGTYDYLLETSDEFRTIVKLA